MVEDRITDGERIAELLASELTGPERPPLHRVEVIDARPDATPSADGATAYRIAVDGDPVGTVRLYPDHAAVELSATLDEGPERSTAEGFATERSAPADLAVERSAVGTEILVRSGAAVKRASDLIADLTA